MKETYDAMDGLVIVGQLSDLWSYLSPDPIPSHPDL